MWTEHPPSSLAALQMGVGEGSEGPWGSKWPPTLSWGQVTTALTSLVSREFPGLCASVAQSGSGGLHDLQATDGPREEAGQSWFAQDRTGAGWFLGQQMLGSTMGHPGSGEVHWTPIFLPASFPWPAVTVLGRGGRGQGPSSLCPMSGTERQAGQALEFDLGETCPALHAVPICRFYPKL